jgi:GNAT superfamily N-acetyltransferase
MNAGDARLLYRHMQPGEESEISDLVARVFDEFVAPGYSPEGVQAFLDYANSAALRERSQVNHFVLVAVAHGKIVGMIEMRNHDHISMLFVDKTFQGKGISRELINRALGISRSNRSDLSTVTVNSSPYAVPIYERLGFRASSVEQVKNGIRFLPMVLKLGHGQGT